MLVDVVVDTNVLVHASNPGVAFYAEAHGFVLNLSKSATALCVDEGFNTDTSKNRSLIGHEYLQHLRIGMMGYALIVHLAARGQIKAVSKRVAVSVGRGINRLVGNSRDRTFLRVTKNSDEALLVTHDFEHFSVKARREMLRKLKVNVLAAKEVTL